MTTLEQELSAVPLPEFLRLVVRAGFRQLSSADQWEFRNWVQKWAELELAAHPRDATAGHRVGVTGGMTQPPIERDGPELGHLTPVERDDVLGLLRVRTEVLDDPHELGVIDRMIRQIVNREPLKTFPLPPATEPAGELKEWADYVGRELRRRRTDAGMTQVQLSELTGIPQSHLSRLENAQHSANVYTLEKIAKALNIDVNELIPPEYRAE